MRRLPHKVGVFAWICGALTLMSAAVAQKVGALAIICAALAHIVGALALMWAALAHKVGALAFMCAALADKVGAFRGLGAQVSAVRGSAQFPAVSRGCAKLEAAPPILKMRGI